MRCIGTINPELDYPEIHETVEYVKRMTRKLQGYGCRIEIPVEHRFWEYGTAVDLYLRYSRNMKHIPTVLNVGGGWDALTPVLVYGAGVELTECEPDAQCRTDRDKMIKLLSTDHRAGKLTLLENGLESLPDEKYDFVFCISVLEHVNGERTAWDALADRVKDGGLLFITTDCVPDKNRNYTFDNLRVTNYDLNQLEERVEQMKAKGLVPIGEPDFHWNGAHVYDYTFFRAGFARPNVKAAVAGGKSVR